MVYKNEAEGVKGHMGSVRSYINKNFVESNPSLVEAMIRNNKIHGRQNNIFARGWMVFRLYVKYVVFRYNPIYVKQKKMIKSIYPESCKNQRENIEKIKEKMEKSSCVVFDIWGVLFYLALDRNQVLALAEAKKLDIGLADTREIRNVLNMEQQQNIEEIMADFTLANPIMHSLLEEAHVQGKEVYLFNNSDYEDMFVQSMLKKYSCNGKLCKAIEEKWLHITNRVTEYTDIKYENVNTIGEGYRPFYYLNTITALYNQIVNIKFHSQAREYSFFYEYGFNCGGILTCGFCQFLNGLGRREGIDKFLFVARDGDIMEKVYKKYFHNIDSSYFIFSRFASFELIFEDFPEEYLDKNIRPRMERKGTDNSIGRILQECGLEFIGQYLGEENLSKEEEMQENSYEKLRRVIIHHKSEIQSSFTETCRAANKYIINEIKDCRKVCVVDLGWNGKSIVYLKHLCERKYCWNGSVIGAMIGASKNETVQNHIRTGLINTYAFENEFWRNRGEKNGFSMEYRECICIEALFSSENDTLLRYGFDENGDVKFIYGKKNKNQRIISEIHKGILDFAESFMPIIQKYDLNITARDAYTPLDCSMKNEKYKEAIYKKYYEEPNAINGF